MAPTSLLTCAVMALASCAGAPLSSVQSPAARPAATSRPARSPAPDRHAQAASVSSARAGQASGVSKALPKPARLAAFKRSHIGREGAWRPSGRRVAGMPAVFETTLTPPGGSQRAGIAWMDTRLLSARLYSGSESPGGGPYRYTAPIRPASARYLVAAFNGGFKMNAAEGGYYAEGRAIYPLRAGAASLVIYKDGSMEIGSWGGQLRMTNHVLAVRQNLDLLVAHRRPTQRARTRDWQLWGATCGVSSCTGPGIEHQWRTAVGVTGDGALLYVQGPGLDPLQLAQLLARAGAVRGMQLDINPYWPIFATYRPTGERGLASASNGHKLLSGTTQGPGIFFEAWWARDFITMSARHPRASAGRRG